MADITDKPVGNPVVRAARSIFMSMGILPVLLIGCVVFFGLMEERFLDGRNLFNVVRQTTYLAIVSIGQMVCLLTAGFDLSIGSTMALASVVSALVMVSVLAGTPEAYVLAIILGLIAGIGVGIIVGSINGVGVAIFNVTPFMMTLGMLSVALGAALTIGGGVPIYGIPKVFKEVFGAFWAIYAHCGPEVFITRKAIINQIVECASTTKDIKRFLVQFAVYDVLIEYELLNCAEGSIIKNLLDGFLTQSLNGG